MSTKFLASWAFWLLLVAAGCRRDRAAQPATSKPPANEVWVTPRQISDAGIATDVVEPRAIGNVLLTMGHVSFSDAGVSHVFSPVTGRVRTLLAEIGSSVRQGQPLAIIQSPDLASAVADLRKAEADLVAARRDFERQQELVEAHAAAQRDFEAADSNYKKSMAERDRAAQKCSLLQADGGAAKDTYTLRAPIAGDVLARSVTIGMEVQGQYSGGNAPELFTIGDLDRVWVLADVFEVDLPKIHTGAPATVSVLAYPGHPFGGRVDWISSALDPATHAAKVRCVIANRRHLLRPEMYATAAIETDARRKLAAPRSAIVRLGEQTMAFVDRGPAPDGGERFERRTVTVDDAQAGRYVPVAAGLSAGDRVVTSGGLILSKLGS